MSASLDANAFQNDPRVHFDKETSKWIFEQENGDVLEWSEISMTWQKVDEDAIAMQQAAYSVAGVDESTPAAPVLARELQQKRKAAGEDKPNKKSKRPPKVTVQRQTAIYIASLPPTTTTEELASCFSKAGLILEDSNGDARIKLYLDKEGKFKGEALIVFLKEESVDLALRLLDDTELVVGSGDGNMKVSKATFENKEKKVEDREMKMEKGKKIDVLKQKTGRRADKLKAKLTDWSSDEEDAASLAAKSKFSRLVVLSGMFTLKELEEDATLLLDLKEDVREECESLGIVTNVTLYDKEVDGIMTIRFKEEISAQACIAKMNKRFFAGRSISAFLFDGTKKYKKSGQGISLEGTGFGTSEDAESLSEADREKQRLEAYAAWLEKDEEQNGK